MSRSSSSLRQEGDRKTVTVSTARTITAPVTTPLSTTAPIITFVEKTKEPSTLSSSETADGDDTQKANLRGKRSLHVFHLDDTHDEVVTNVVEEAETGKMKPNYFNFQTEQQQSATTTTAMTRFEFYQRSLSMGSPSSADDGIIPLSRAASLPIWDKFSWLAADEEAGESTSRSCYEPAGNITSLRQQSSDSKFHLIPRLTKQQFFQKTLFLETGSSLKINNCSPLRNYVQECETSRSTYISHDRCCYHYDHNDENSDKPSMRGMRGKSKKKKKRRKGNGSDAQEVSWEDIEPEYVHFYDFSRKEIRDIEGAVVESCSEEMEEKTSSSSKEEMAHVSSFQIPYRVTQLFPTSVHRRNDCEDMMELEDDNVDSGGDEDHDPLLPRPNDVVITFKSIHEQQEHERACELVSLTMQLPFKDQLGNDITPAFEVSDAEAYMDMLNIVASEMKLQEELHYRSGQMTRNTTANRKKVRISETFDYYVTSSDDQSEEEEKAGGAEEEPNLPEMLQSKIFNESSLEYTTTAATGQTSPVLLQSSKERGSKVVPPLLVSQQDSMMGREADNPLEVHSTLNGADVLEPEASTSCDDQCLYQEDDSAGKTSQSLAQICSEEEPRSESIPSGSVYSENLSNVPSASSSGDLTKICSLDTASTMNIPALCCYLEKNWDEKKVWGSGSGKYPGRMEGVAAEDLGSLPPAPQPSSSCTHHQRGEQNQSSSSSSIYVQSRMSPSNNKRRKPCSLQPHQSKIDSGTMNVSSSESVKLENIHVRPESIHKMLMLQAEILKEPDKYKDPSRFDAFDLVELDYAAMEKYIKFLIFHSLLRKEQERRGNRRGQMSSVKNRSSSHKSVGMTQANDNNMDSSSRLEQQKDWDKDEEIRVTGLCIRIKNFLNLGRRLRKVSPGKFCWRQEKNKSFLSPTRTSTTAASHDSNTTASTTGAATITTVSMDRRRKELQCEIEGRQVVTYDDSDYSGTSSSELRSSKFPKSTTVVVPAARTKERRVGGAEIPIESALLHKAGNEKDKEIGVGLEGSSESFTQELLRAPPPPLPLPTTNLSSLSSLLLVPNTNNTPCGTFRHCFHFEDDDDDGKKMKKKMKKKLVVEVDEEDI